MNCIGFINFFLKVQTTPLGLSDIMVELSFLFDELGQWVPVKLLESFLFLTYGTICLSLFFGDVDSFNDERLNDFNWNYFCCLMNQDNEFQWRCWNLFRSQHMEPSVCLCSLMMLIHLMNEWMNDFNWNYLCCLINQDNEFQWRCWKVFSQHMVLSFCLCY